MEAFLKRFYLFERSIKRTRGRGGAERETDSLLSREPNTGLYPRTQIVTRAKGRRLTEPPRCPIETF